MGSVGYVLRLMEIAENYNRVLPVGFPLMAYFLWGISLQSGVAACRRSLPAFCSVLNPQILWDCLSEAIGVAFFPPPLPARSAISGFTLVAATNKNSIDTSVIIAAWSIVL